LVFCILGSANFIEVLTVSTFDKENRGSLENYWAPIAILTTGTYDHILPSANT